MKFQPSVVAAAALLFGSAQAFAPISTTRPQQSLREQEQLVAPLQAGLNLDDIGRRTVGAFAASVCILSNVAALPAVALDLNQDANLRGVGAPSTVMLAAGGGGRAGSSSSAKKPSSSSSASKPVPSKTPSAGSAVATKAPPSPVKTTAATPVPAKPVATAAVPAKPASIAAPTASVKPVSNEPTKPAVASASSASPAAAPSKTVAATPAPATAETKSSASATPAPTPTETKSLASSETKSAPATPPPAPQKEVVREVVREKTIIQEVQAPPTQQTIVIQQPAAPVMAAPVVAAPDPGMAVLGLGLSAVNAIGEGMREARRENEIRQQKAELTQARVKEAELEARLRNLEYDQMARNAANAAQAAQAAAAPAPVAAAP